MALSIIYEDNKSAIKLTEAPAVTRKSRHIFVKHHYIRWLHKTNHIKLQHQSTHDIVPDGLTRYIPLSAFPFFRARILNLYHPSDPFPPTPYPLTPLRHHSHCSPNHPTSRHSSFFFSHLIALSVYSNTIIGACSNTVNPYTHRHTLS